MSPRLEPNGALNEPAGWPKVDQVFEAALKAMREMADIEGIDSIAIPRIPCGYGGLSWKKVKAVIKTVFADWAGTLTIYEEFRQKSDLAAFPGWMHALECPYVCIPAGFEHCTPTSRRSIRIVAGRHS